MDNFKKLIASDEGMVVLSTFLEQQDYERLVAISEELGMKRSTLYRTIFKAFIADYERDKNKFMEERAAIFKKGSEAEVDYKKIGITEL